MKIFFIGSICFISINFLIAMEFVLLNDAECKNILAMEAKNSFASFSKIKALRDLNLSDLEFYSEVGAVKNDDGSVSFLLKNCYELAIEESQGMRFFMTSSINSRIGQNGKPVLLKSDKIEKVVAVRAYSTSFNYYLYLGLSNSDIVAYNSVQHYNAVVLFASLRNSEYLDVEDVYCDGSQKIYNRYSALKEKFVNRDSVKFEKGQLQNIESYWISNKK